jgi:Cu/Zn superoxide dismutase
MSNITRRGMRITAAAAGAGVIAVGAWAITAQARPADAATSPMNSSAVTATTVRLSPMPQGTIAFGKDSKGHIDVTVNAFGLTPGSSHEVRLMKGHRAVATFSTLTANSMGQVKDETLGSDYSGALGSMQVAMLEGNGGDTVALTEIARTASYASTRHAYPLISAETGAKGKSWGTPKGSAVIAYSRTAKMIMVTVNASGFAPGMHAAHIHLGSCDAQGPVLDTLADFNANAKGQIVKETRMITDVTAVPPATGWYLNLHQGNSSNIMSNGRPTINFRPLACANIVSKG